MEDTLGTNMKGAALSRSEWLLHAANVPERDDFHATSLGAVSIIEEVVHSFEQHSSGPLVRGLANPRRSCQKVEGTRQLVDECVGRSLTLLAPPLVCTLDL